MHVLTFGTNLQHSISAQAAAVAGWFYVILTHFMDFMEKNLCRGGCFGGLCAYFVQMFVQSGHSIN